MTVLGPDDPRAHCDAVTPEELDAVVTLAALADRVKAFCVAALITRPPGERWLDLADELHDCAGACRRRAVLES